MPHEACSTMVDLDRYPRRSAPLHPLRWASLGLCLGLGSLLLGCEETTENDASNTVDVAEVVRAPMRIAVTEGGDLESKNPVVVRSAVAGRAAITELVAEGSMVKAGEIVARLDDSGIVEKLNRQNVTVTEAENNLTQAESALEIQRKRNEEQALSARTDLDLARRALTAYVEAKLPTELKNLESSLTLKRAQLARALEEREASERLFASDFIAKTEKDRDVLQYEQAQQEVEVAERRLAQLRDWDSKDEVTRLSTQVEVKKIALARVTQQNTSELSQKVEAVRARQNRVKLQKEEQLRLNEQLEACVVTAPSSGMVVYAKRGGRRGNESPIIVGTEVRQREELLKIPDLENLIVQVEVHESSVKKVRAGQRCWVTVEAIPDRTFPGTVRRVALVPSSQSSWMNPDLKVYETRVELDEVIEGMKPGMHAQVEILIQDLDDALQVPMQAVRQSGSRTFAYVRPAAGGEPELREVKVGPNNKMRVQILEGLNEGEEVFLGVPSNAPPLPEAETREFMEARPGAAGSGGGSGGGASGAGAPRGDSNLRPPSGGNGARPEGASGGRSGGGRPNKAQMEAWRKRTEGMSDEEKAALMKRMREQRSGAGGEGQ